jgi:ribosomal protein S18 acetylase RimI-like enzyme
MTAEPITTSPKWLTQVIIRQITEKDLPALEWGGEYAHFRRLYAEIYQGVLKGRAVMWAAEIPEVGLVGQMFVQLNSSRKELANGSSRAYIYSFRIQSFYRDKGIGTLMLQTVEADLEKRGFQSVTLNVGIDNPGARRLYERRGYRVITSEPGHWSYQDEKGISHEVVEPAWRMEKQLRKSA